MIKIELKPLRGISIEGVGEVLLGQSRQDVEKLLGRQPSLIAHIVIVVPCTIIMNLELTLMRLIK